jgi:DNA-binding beta-propeller fold protein YncE
MTRQNWAISSLLALSSASILSCAAGDLASERNGGAGDLDSCFTDNDCPTGLVCKKQQCVSIDDLPPEKEENHTFLRPKTSEHYVFALSPDSDLVAVIDPTTLAIQSVVLPHEPMGIELVPNQDAVAVVSRGGASVSLLKVTENGTSLKTQKTTRKYPALSLSPDGKWAVLWTPDGTTPDAGAEGIIGLVDLTSLASGQPKAVLERAAGRRHTNVFFRQKNGVATAAVILGKEELAVIDLANPEAQPLPKRIALPTEYAEIATREAVAPPESAYILLRSLATKDVGVFDVDQQQLSRLTLPAIPTDLDLTADGTKAVAVLRETSQVAWFPLPEALTNATLIKTATVALPGHDCTEGENPCVAAPGQAVLSPDGDRVALFTNARASESLATLDLTTGNVLVFAGLQKLVRTLGVGPDGHSVVVLHRPEPTSTVADTYERMVDKAEGYSVVDLEAGVAQLKLTDSVPPQEFVFAGNGTHAAVTLRNDVTKIYRVEAIDLQTLVVSPLSLASAPQFCGAFAGDSARVWVTQEHPAGRIAFVDLQTKAVRTATGFELNSEIQ